MSEAIQQQRYRVLERLAVGGMAEVFLAESAGIEGFKKLVTIKRVLPALAEKKLFMAMFLDEARLSAHLSHSNVVQVFDIGVGDDAYFIVMEYVDGSDLKAISEHFEETGKKLSVEAACLIAARICEGLTYAHELAGPDGEPLRIVHRDVSPPNILITKHGEVKIVDFGLAKATSQLAKSDAGIVKGKFGYLSPEAALGKPVDHRTDIFAVGIILWEMLAGRRLFLGDTDFDTVGLVRKAVVPSLHELNPDVPAELEPIVQKALARDPAERYLSARDLGKDLTAFLFRLGHPVSSFDIANVVQEAMTQRRRRPADDRTSVVDRLIEEALLEFTSLQDEEETPEDPPLPEPPDLGFEDVTKWADELAQSPNNHHPEPRSGRLRLTHRPAAENHEDRRRISTAPQQLSSKPNSTSAGSTSDSKPKKARGVSDGRPADKALARRPPEARIRAWITTAAVVVIALCAAYWALVRH